MSFHDTTGKLGAHVADKKNKKQKVPQMLNFSLQYSNRVFKFSHEIVIVKLNYDTSSRVPKHDGD